MVDLRPCRPRVAVIGGYGVGLTFVTDRVPNGGETVVGRSFSSGHGGKGSNQAIAAARLGAEVALLTSIGDDDFGRAARGLWAEEGVDASAVRTVPRPTMVGAILVDAEGENRIIIAAGALDLLEPSDVEAFTPWIASADVVLVSLEIPLAVAERACQIGRAHERIVVLNPAPATSLKPSLLEAVDYLVPNRSEAAQLIGLAQPTVPMEMVGTLCEWSRATVVLTLGADGALLGRRGVKPTHLPAQPVQVVDTTGAGDAFNAAFAVALAEGATPQAATAYAIRAGGHAVSVAEVIPSLPHRAELGGPARHEDVERKDGGA